MTDLTPSEVVRRAYHAAFCRRYEDANRWVEPRLLDSLRKSHEAMRGSLAEIRRLAKANPSSLNRRLQALVAGIEEIVPLADGRQMWRNRRHGGSVVRFVIVRETIRSNRAWVTIRLHLKEGSMVEHREVLHRGKDGWRIAEWLEKRRRTSA